MQSQAGPCHTSEKDPRSGAQAIRCMVDDAQCFVGRMIRLHPLPQCDVSHALQAKERLKEAKNRAIVELYEAKVREIWKCVSHGILSPCQSRHQSDEEEFYYIYNHQTPTVESGYPMPIGLKTLRYNADGKLIKTFTNILGKLTQEHPIANVEHDANYVSTSSMQINAPTVNHGGITKNPKINDRKLRDMPMKDRPASPRCFYATPHRSFACMNKKTQAPQIMARTTRRMFRPWQQASENRAPGMVHIRLRLSAGAPGEHHL